MSGQPKITVEALLKRIVELEADLRGARMSIGELRREMDAAERAADQAMGRAEEAHSRLDDIEGGL